MKSHHDSPINVVIGTKQGHFVTGGKDNKVNYFA